MIHFTADSIAMRFGVRQILSDVYIEADAGDVIGFLGPNGSGKSTLYKCLLGAFRSSAGSMRINGRWIAKERAPRFLGYLPQDSYLPRDIRLRTSVALILGRKGTHDLIESDQRACSLLTKKPRTLSQGEVRYVECLVALSLARPILLLDEPFSQVEPLYCEILARHIREGARDRVTLVSDHLYRDVQGVATRIAVLEQGTLRNVDNSADSLRRHGYIT